METQTIRNHPFFLSVFASAMLLIACGPEKEEVKESLASVSTTSEQEYILRGEYLTKIGGCNDCHTPKIFTERGMELDSSRLFAGHPDGSPLPEIDPRALQPGYWTLFNAHLTAAVGPWGLTYARNLTPHETGIKGWKEEVFIKALRTGKHMGLEAGRPIMPPMPWFNYVDAEEEDLKAIFRYLKSLQPVDNYVPDPVSPDEVLKMVAEAKNQQI